MDSLASIAMLPARRAWVRVGPPLAASRPRSTSAAVAPMMLPTSLSLSGWPAALPTRLNREVSVPPAVREVRSETTTRAGQRDSAGDGEGDPATRGNGGEGQGALGGGAAAGSGIGQAVDDAVHRHAEDGLAGIGGRFGLRTGEQEDGNPGEDRERGESIMGRYWVEASLWEGYRTNPGARYRAPQEEQSPPSYLPSPSRRDTGGPSISVQTIASRSC